MINLILIGLKRHGRSIGGCTRCRAQVRNGEAAGGGRVTLAKSCAQTQLSNEAAGENVEYEVDGGGMLATFCHQRKLRSMTFREPAPVPLDSGNSSRVELGGYDFDM